ncbi:MAG: haloacid dehalogenase type II [Hyphomicrobiaceae bacterium]|nr:haloacid dehalogenase type II [Hyphomicrobiaceae bacterium]
MAPPVYVFDAYGTLLDVHSAAAQHSISLGARWERLSDLWRTKQLEYTWVRAGAGRTVSFWQITENSLDYAAEVVGGITAEQRADLLGAYRRLDAYAEVAATLSTLKEKGARLAVLSNGDPDMLSEAVKAAGLDGLFDAVLSVTEAGTFKPHPAVYRLASDHFGVAAQAITFVSSNRWDVAGAHAFGFRTAWVNRNNRPDEYAELAPDLIITSLDALLG